jgi:DNA-binding transcriptional ArsR family regulator
MNQVFKALADPTRRKILELLRNRDLAAGEISSCFEITKPSMSKHFKILREADLIQARRAGTSIVYRLNASLVEEVLLGLITKLHPKTPNSQKEKL